MAHRKSGLFSLKKQQIEVHTPEKLPVVYGIEDTISDSDLLPDFELEVKDVFEN